MLAELERVASGEVSRLMLFLPPGSAKSTYASILFPPWFLAANPAASIIAASHTAELAERFGRRVRNLIAGHTLTLGLSLAADAHAAGRFETAAGGEYFAAGVGGAITGRRADLAIVDDPVRGREDADSPAIRDKIWDWFRSDLYSRLKPGARIVLIQTRWHEDDLAGRLLADATAGGDAWEVVNLPALAEAADPIGRAPGEALWPEWEDAPALARKRRAIGAREWSALYQQRPAPAEGAYFRSEWLRRYASAPPRETMRVYGASDYAVTASGGDYTVHLLVGLDPARRMYLLDLWRAQTGSDAWIEAWCDLVLAWQPLEWAEEAGQINAAVGPFLQRRARERGAACYRRQFPSRTDKAIRAQSIRGRMAMEGLYLPANAPWLADFEAELLRFPAGRHDDQVDALGLIGQLLDHLSYGIAPLPEKDRRLTANPPTLGDMVKAADRARGLGGVGRI